MPGTLALDCRYRSSIHPRCLKVQGSIPKEQWFSKKSNDFNDLCQKNSHEQASQGLSTGYPQVIHNPFFLQTYPQVIHRLLTGSDRSKDLRSDRHRSPRSEPRRSEHQRHKDSDDSEAYSDSDVVSSDVYVLYSIKVSYTLYSISRVPGYVYSI